eukprot:scaffold4518_cov410-Prasinococcus_capsulatus_cf.AAC.14
MVWMRADRRKRRILREEGPPVSPCPSSPHLRRPCAPRGHKCCPPLTVAGPARALRAGRGKTAPFPIGAHQCLHSDRRRPRLRRPRLRCPRPALRGAHLDSPRPPLERAKGAPQRSSRGPEGRRAPPRRRVLHAVARRGSRGGAGWAGERRLGEGRPSAQQPPAGARRRRVVTWPCSPSSDTLAWGGGAALGCALPQSTLARRLAGLAFGASEGGVRARQVCTTFSPDHPRSRRLVGGCLTRAFVTPNTSLRPPSTAGCRGACLREPG